MTDARGRSIVTSTVLILTCLLLGLLTGGMLVIGVSLVSFWKSLSPSAFQAWFASHSHLIGRLMIALGFGGVASALVAVLACWRGPATCGRWLLVATFSVVGVMVTYPIFFAAANEAFERGGLSDLAVPALLDRWVAWHWFRTGLGTLGFVAALRALHEW
jgi:Domain of unknown function (DUF1772)